MTVTASHAAFAWVSQRRHFLLLIWLAILAVLGAPVMLGTMKGRSVDVEEPTSNGITDTEYYGMPPLYELDEYYGCLVRGGVYCLGRFELEAPVPAGSHLLRLIREYSADWVRHSNHSRVYRGMCLPRRCSARDPQHEDQDWFASCMNMTLMSEYNISARLMKLDYCTRELQGKKLTAGGVAFIGLLVVLVLVAIVSTTLDLNLSDEKKKDIGWALSWSLRRSWRMLKQPAQSKDTDLRFLDGLRAKAMGVIIGMHTGAFTVAFNVTDTRFYEENILTLINGNLTLVVQVFFIVSSFLMAKKVLQQEHIPAQKNFIWTMQNRIMRILPSYAVLMLYMVSLHEYCGTGPLWHRAVRDEVETCRQTWWMNLLFINNFNKGSKCQGQTWYLAADMQLYAAGLLLTLLLRGRRAAPVLALLMASFVVLNVCMAYTWNLIPLYALHSTDNFRDEYTGVLSFDLLYQSPWGNAFASLTGLSLAHAHRSLQTSKFDLHQNTLYRWAAKLAGISILPWMLLWPCIHPLGPPAPLRSALLAGLVGPVFCLLMGVTIMELLQGRYKPLHKFLSSRASGLRARLSLCVLLVHFPLARILLVTRDWPEQIDLFKLTFYICGVSTMSYTVAMVLAQLVELPAQRLYRELCPRDKRGD